MPSRAHINWTAAIRGNVSSAIHSVPYPYAAPATEYVEIPEGSSSAAPVISPGPRTAKDLFKTFCFLPVWAFLEGRFILAVICVRCDARQPARPCPLRDAPAVNSPSGETCLQDSPERQLLPCCYPAGALCRVAFTPVRIPMPKSTIAPTAIQCPGMCTKYPA